MVWKEVFKLIAAISTLPDVNAVTKAYGQYLGSGLVLW
jgi:hypothetical protein